MNTSVFVFFTQGAPADIEAAATAAAAATGVRVLSRLRGVSWLRGAGWVYLEWSFGSANRCVPAGDVEMAWRAFFEALARTEEKKLQAD